MSLLLFGTGVFAGCVDAIAGGGGIITIPVLLSVGLPPLQALGTNKFQGAVGTSVAVWHFIRRGLLEPRLMIPLIIAALAGAMVGAIFLQYIDASHLAQWLPVLIILIGLYFLFSPRVGDEDAHERLSQRAYTLFISPLVGFYDGAFGAGTGSFFALSLVECRGFNLSKATAQAKVLNLTSNLSAVAVFIFTGKILWLPAFIMAAGQIIGGRLGAGMVILKGSRLIKPLLVTISFAMAIRLIVTNPQSPLYQAAASLFS